MLPRFLELTGDLPALEYNASSTALASSIVAYSGGNYGQVDGVHPVWGTFTLEFGGWTSDPIRADASADELRDSLEALPSIGDVSVYKTTIGQCLDQLDRQIFPNASRLSVWEVHFDGRCAISGWDFCPDTLGDVAMLAADASGLAYDLSPYERQAAPTVRVTEAIKGTTGNLVTSSGGDEIIEYSATHQQHTDVGIDMYETQRLRCATQSGGNFSLSMLNNATGLWETTTNVTGLTNIANLKAALLALPGVKPGLTVTGGNANGDICCTDATASTCAWVSVAFVGNFGTLPMLEFGEEQGVDLEIEEIVKGIDSLEYAGDGLYRLAVTPTVSGNYTFTLRISPQFFGGANATTDVSTELSAGLIVLPAQASGPQSHHYADLRATTAVESTFLVQARDRFGNRLGRSLDAGPGSHFAVDLNGTGFEGGGREGDRSLVAGAVDDKYVPNTDGLYEASYTPELAGPHVLEVELTQPGGLLATYYAQMDFVDPALHATGWRAWPSGPTKGGSTSLQSSARARCGNASREMIARPRVWEVGKFAPSRSSESVGARSHPRAAHRWPYHEPKWCPPEALTPCDSTRLDGPLDLDFGGLAPLSQTEWPDFPADFFSARWVGHLLGPVDGVVTLHLRTTEAVSLVLDGETLIDTMDASGSLVDVASANFTATKNALYALEISFVEEIDGAALSFEWTVGGVQAVVPASALYYTRHARLSPETVVVYPDRIAAAATAAEGDGTLACVALEECSFVVTATDADGNYRVNTGADELVVEILGVGDWAGEGRTNEYDSYGVIEVDQVTDVNVAWDYVGTASVYNNVSKLYNLSGAFETLLRGDVLSIGDGDLQDASPEFIAIGSGAFYLNDTVGADERSVPLADVWRGADAHRVRVYKGAYAGDTARHTISYTPYVRGTYDLDVRVKKTEEVQQVVVSVGAGLRGNQPLVWGVPTKL